MSADKVYQLKGTLRHITPLIWRRLLVTSDTTIAQFHYILQTVMGWEDWRLHQFRIHGRTYGIYRDGGLLFDDDPHRVKLAISNCAGESVSSMNTIWAIGGGTTSGSN